MRTWVLFSSIILTACGAEPASEAVPAKPVQETSATGTTTTVRTTNVDSSLAKIATTGDEVAPPAPTKKPSGVYQFQLPYEEGKTLLQTVAFYPNTYRLQEEYSGKRDSIVTTEGTWAPSGGTIWLYKDQVVRARYAWKGDTLQYISPRLKQNLSLQKLSSIAKTENWQKKAAEGAQFFGTGTEPFWSVEVTNSDSIVVKMPDWTAPLQVKLSGKNAGKDSTVYQTLNDSLRLTVYPRFCNDGMSDYLYTQKVKLVYRGQAYTGCGEIFKH